MSEIRVPTKIRVTHDESPGDPIPLANRTDMYPMGIYEAVNKDELEKYIDYITGSHARNLYQSRDEQGRGETAFMSCRILQERVSFNISPVTTYYLKESLAPTDFPFVFPDYHIPNNVYDWSVYRGSRVNGYWDGTNRSDFFLTLDSTYNTPKWVFRWMIHPAMWIPNPLYERCPSTEPGGLTESLDSLPGTTARVWETRTVSGLSSYSNKKVKLVFHYVQQSEGFTFRADLQLDDINIDGTNYSFENGVPEGWETSDGSGVGTDVIDKYGDISSYDDVDWVPIETATNNGRWNRDSGGTPSSNTGLETGNSGDYYLYAETSADGQGSANRAYGRGFFLRTEFIQLGSNPTLSYAVARDGSRIGDLNVYLDVEEEQDGQNQEPSQLRVKYALKATKPRWIQIPQTSSVNDLNEVYVPFCENGSLSNFYNSDISRYKNFVVTNAKWDYPITIPKLEAFDMCEVKNLIGLPDYTQHGVQDVPYYRVRTQNSWDRSVPELNDAMISFPEELPRTTRLKIEVLEYVPHPVCVLLDAINRCDLSGTAWEGI